MADETGTSVATQGLTTIYANIAGVTISFHDMRIYLAEALPAKVDFGVTLPALKPQQALVNPIACVIVNPEFARSLRDALTLSIEKYEGLFGPLRPNPAQPQIPPQTE
jgi:Protein of unknown function (DUF3467)